MIDRYVTPEEAQTKWCPIQTPSQACVGAECMAWRWRDEGRTWVDDGNGRGHWEFIKKTHGYCGMVKT